MVILATDYIESRQILNPEQEGFRADRSYTGAINHIGLCVADDHITHTRNIVLCYLDFKGASPSADHNQLVRTLSFLCIPEDFTRLIMCYLVTIRRNGGGVWGGIPWNFHGRIDTVCPSSGLEAISGSFVDGGVERIRELGLR